MIGTFTLSASPTFCRGDVITITSQLMPWRVLEFRGGAVECKAFSPALERVTNGRQFHAPRRP